MTNINDKWNSRLFFEGTLQNRQKIEINKKNETNTDSNIEHIIEKFTQGNMEIRDVLQELRKNKAIVLNIQRNNQTSVIRFRYKDKSYTISCNTIASLSSKDNKVNGERISKQDLEMYKLPPEIIKEYFDEAIFENGKVTHYVLKMNSTYSNVQDLIHDLLEKSRNDLIYDNFINNKNKQSSNSSILLSTNDGKMLLSTNFTEYIDEIDIARGEDAIKLQEEVVNKIIQDFSRGNLTIAQARTLLSALKVPYKISSQNNTYQINFNFHNKEYVITCNKEAAKSSTDNIIIKTYSVNLLKQQYHFTDAIITQYFEPVSKENNINTAYTMKDNCKYNSPDELYKEIVYNSSINFNLQEFLNNTLQMYKRPSITQLPNQHINSQQQLVISGNLTIDSPQILSDRSLNKLLKDFPQGKISLDTAHNILKLIKATNIKEIEQDNKITISFVYNNKQYQITSELEAVQSGQDDKTVRIYTENDILKYLGITNKQIIKEYFTPALSENNTVQQYMITDSEKFKTLNDILEDINTQATQSQHKVVLLNFNNNINKESNDVNDLLKFNGQPLDKNNYIYFISNPVVNITIERSRILDKLLKDFSNGNLSYYQAAIILQSIGVNDLEEKQTENFQYITFSFENTKYIVKCEQNASSQSNDNITSQDGTYSKTFVDSENNQTIYQEFYNNGNLKYEELRNNNNEIISSKTYNKDGSKITETTYKDGKISSETVYEYAIDESTGNIIQDSEKITQTEYLENKHYIKTTVENGEKISKEYDYFDKLVKETRYHKNGTLMSEVTYGYSGKESEKTYDENGRILSDIQDFLQDKIYQGRTYEYDSDGNLINKTTYQKGHKQTTLYYPNGQISTETSYSYDGKIENEKQYNEQGTLIKEIKYKYNGDIEYIKTYDKNGTMTNKTSYDYSNNKKEEFYEDGKLTHSIKYNENNNISEEYEYDENEQLKTKTWYIYDENNKPQSAITYDRDNNKVSEKKWNYDNDGKLIDEKIYDAHSNLIATITRFADGRPKTETKYNKYHKIESEKSFYDNAQQQVYTETYYNSNGNLVSQTVYDENGNKTIERNYKGNDKNYLDSEVVYNSDGSYQITQYDNNGNKATILQYNASKQLTQKLQFNNKNKLVYTMNYVYNQDSSYSTELTHQSGSKTKITYNASGEVETLTEIDINGIQKPAGTVILNANGNYEVTANNDHSNMLYKTIYTQEGIKIFETIPKYNANNTLNYTISLEYNLEGYVGILTKRNANEKYDNLRVEYSYDSDGTLKNTHIDRFDGKTGNVLAKSINKLTGHAYDIAKLIQLLNSPGTKGIGASEARERYGIWATAFLQASLGAIYAPQGSIKYNSYHSAPEDLQSYLKSKIQSQIVDQYEQYNLDNVPGYTFGPNSDLSNTIKQNVDFKNFVKNNLDELMNGFTATDENNAKGLTFKNHGDTNSKDLYYTFNNVNVVKSWVDEQGMLHLIIADTYDFNKNNKEGDMVKAGAALMDDGDLTAYFTLVEVVVNPKDFA